MSEATAFVPTAFEEFSSELRDVPVEEETEPFGEAETDVFNEPATVFAGKAELSEAVRTFVCNSEAASARRALSAVNSENTKNKHPAHFTRK